MLNRFFPALFALWLIAPVSAQTPLRVAAAADLEPVLPPILAEFQQATGIHAEATYQASAMLTTQIMNGAPFDLFLSADLGYPRRLIEAGVADAAGSAGSSTPIIYARGTLVLWARKDSGLPPPSLDLLRNPNLKRLAIANPDRAPYGRAAVAALTSLKLYDALKPRLVTGENIAQSAQFAD
jgi:molybdate transport system substrate-binding protein